MRARAYCAVRNRKNFRRRSLAKHAKLAKGKRAKHNSVAESWPIIHHDRHYFSAFFASFALFARYLLFRLDDAQGSDAVLVHVSSSGRFSARSKYGAS